MKINNFRILRYIPSFIWMAVIFYFSSRSTAGIGTTAWDRFLILKAFHLIEYAVLAVLIYFALLQPRPSLVFTYLYAVSDEIHQSFTPGRTPKFSDTLIDLVGGIIGIFIVTIVVRKLFPKLYKLFIKPT